jgi:prephenate dehydrogenase/chorismate mutase/prephenate dehydrogenase
VRTDAVLADVTSIKVPAFEAMRDHHPGAFVGLHPMCGPGVASFLAQAVVVCHGRRREDYQWLLELIETDGGRLVECGAEEHDAMMTAVQAVRHFTTMSLGSFLAEEGIDVVRSLDFASPVYRLEIDFVGRLFAQDPSLYVDIMLATTSRREAITRLAETFVRLARIVSAGDREGLVSVFERTREALGGETNRALAESSLVIESFGTMLAAHEAERRAREEQSSADAG